MTEKQTLLEAIDIPQRIHQLIMLIEREQYIAELEQEIGERVRATIEKNQKEDYLREQIKVIQSELGEDEGSQEEQDLYKELLETTPIPEDARQRVAKDIARLARMPTGHPEGAVLRNYLDLLFELPWGKTDPERLNIARARRILNRDHYGLEKVKERILEYLAVRKLRMEIGQTTSKGPILCLVGPPGVGKPQLPARSPKLLEENISGCLWAAFAMKLKSGDIAGPISAPCPDVSLTRFDKLDEIIR